MLSFVLELNSVMDNGVLSVVPSIAATSLAIPLWLKANALSGVTSMSMAL